MTPTSPVTLSRALIERDTMFFRGELDDGQGERWLQHDGAGNAWTPDAETLELLNLIDQAASRAVTETPEGLAPSNLFAEDREFNAQVDGWHLTNGNLDAMNAALSRTFPIYSDEEAGTDIDGDAVTMLDTLLDNGQIVVNAAKLKSALRAVTETPEGLERALRLVFFEYAVVPDREEYSGPHVAIRGNAQEVAALLAPKVAARLAHKEEHGG